MKNNFSKIFVGCATVIIIGGAFWGGSRVARWHAARTQTNAALQAQDAATRIAVVQAPTTHTTSTINTLDSNKPFNLAVPFIPQAPRKNWDADHEEYCEEASLLMVYAYKHNKRWTIDEQEIELARMRDWQQQTFGYFESVTVDEIVRIAREYLKFERVRVIDNPTYEQLRVELAAGRPIIIPANGRALGNPFFSGLGPPYHMLVLRGITTTGDFITNDPGTRRGENYVYKRATIMSVIHDYRYGPREKKVADGTPRVIIIE